MEIQNEKEAFESVFTEAKGWDLTFIMGCYQNIETLRAFAGWLAAKAQAVPEGFVLVEKTKLMQIVGSAAIIEPITRGNPLMSKYKTELDFILSTVRAVIEAQEPTND